MRSFMEVSGGNYFGIEGGGGGGIEGLEIWRLMRGGMRGEEKDDWAGRWMEGWRG